MSSTITTGVEANISMRLRKCTQNMVLSFDDSEAPAKVSSGPIVRVNPDLISIHDPEAYSEIYVVEGKRKTENYSAFSQGIGFDGWQSQIKARLMLKLYRLALLDQKP